MTQAVLTHFNKENRKTIAAARRGEYYQPDAEALRRVLQPYIEQGALLGVSEALEPLIAFGLGFDEALINEIAVAFARMHVYSGYGAGLAAEINATTTAAIQKHVSAWLQSGDKIDELIRALEPTFGRNRAETIAVTEVTNAISGGNIGAWKDVNRQLGVEIVSGMQWSTSNQENVCPICSALGGLTYSADGAVPSSIEQQEKRGITTGLDDVFVHPGGRRSREVQGAYV